LSSCVARTADLFTGQLISSTKYWRCQFQLLTSMNTFQSILFFSACMLWMLLDADCLSLSFCCGVFLFCNFQEKHYHVLVGTRPSSLITFFCFCFLLLFTCIVFFMLVNSRAHRDLTRVPMAIFFDYFFFFCLSVWLLMKRL